MLTGLSKTRYWPNHRHNLAATHAVGKQVTRGAATNIG